MIGYLPVHYHYDETEPAESPARVYPTREAAREAGAAALGAARTVSVGVWEVELPAAPETPAHFGCTWMGDK